MAAEVELKIKVQNDHAAFTKSFYPAEILLSAFEGELPGMIEETVKEFNQPVEKVSVTAKMRDV